MGLPVDILDTMGMVVTKSKITFVSPQVDNGLQGILVKAEIPNGTKIRNEQIVNARVTWSMAPKPTIPVLAVTQIGGQAFVYIAAARGEGYMAHQVPVKLGETIGNMYPVLDGLKEGDQVIVSGLQMIGEGAPVQPMHGPAGPPKS
jgi:multidrug efflux pump subunit AcrA (membrane-fusion protein)